MAYTDQKQNRTVALGSVALVHVGLAVVLASGLAVKLAPPPEPTDTIIYDVPDPIIPKPTPPDPPKEMISPREPAASPLHAPISIVPVPAPNDVATTPIIYPPAPLPSPMAEVGPPIEPSPPPVSLARGLQVKGDQGGWFPQDSYPAAARRAGAEGRVSVSVDVGTNGRVTACRVVGSSGNEELDAATCRLATRNGRFTPALNAAGEATPATITLRPVRWRLEE